MASSAPPLNGPAVAGASDGDRSTAGEVPTRAAVAAKAEVTEPAPVAASPEEGARHG
jgi:hypothetical protein